MNLRPASSLGFSLLTSLAISHTAMAKPVALPSSSSVNWKVQKQSGLITALVRDHRGRIFVGTENRGVWMRDANGTTWRNFSAKSLGLPSDAIISGLAVDCHNRVWAGTNRNGVSVWNGMAWLNYGVLDGVLGERVWSIAVSPFDGDVWIATNEGVTRYSNSKKTWRTYTRASGLQSDQVQAIGWARNGDIVLGTQADGLVLGRAHRTRNGIEYSNWRQVRAASDLPGSEPFGKSLPSNLITDILRAHDGTLVVATTQGLAWSRNNGASWRYLRGRDYADKVRRRLFGAPRGWKEKTGALLSEDYVTCLAQDDAGRIYVGHRGNTTSKVSYQVLDASLGKTIFDSTRDSKAEAAKDFVKDILPLPDGRVLLAHYGGGLSQSCFRAMMTQRPIARNIEYSKATSSFPEAAPMPSLNDLNVLLAQLERVPRPDKVQPAVVALSDDWATRGAWQGRYGRYWIDLCGMVGMEDGGNYLWGAGPQPIHYFSRSGVSNTPREGMRYFISELYTDNPNSLEMPQIYMHSRVLHKYTTWKTNRRQSENNDFTDNDVAAVKNYNRQDLNVYTTLNVPAGQFVLSVYTYNNDGDAGLTRSRDYRISVRPHSPAQSIYDVSNFNRETELARGRVHDFRSGVWKRFLVRGPRQVTVEMARNYSTVTKFSAVTLDELKPTPAPYFRTIQADRVLDLQQQTRDNDLMTQSRGAYEWRFKPERDASSAALKLFNRLEEMRTLNPVWWATESRRFYAPLTRFLQNAPAAPSSAELMAEMRKTISQRAQVAPSIETLQANARRSRAARLANCYYALRMFDQFEKTQRAAATTPARDIELAQRWDGMTQVTIGKGYETISRAAASMNQ